MATFKRSWLIVGRLVFCLACHQLISIANCNFQARSDEAQSESSLRSNKPASTNQTTDLDEILRDTNLLLDTLDRKIQAVDGRNRTLERRHEPDESRLLASLAEGFSSERRPAKAPDTGELLQAASSEQDQQQASFKRSRQLTGSDEAAGVQSAARFTDQHQFTERHIRFSLDLMRAVFAGHTKANSIDSFLISPVSIQTVLMMMHLGARGQTRRELSSCLHLLAPSSANSNSSGNNLQNTSNTSTGRNPKLFRRHPQQVASNQRQNNIQKIQLQQQQQQQASSLQQGNQLHEQFGGAMRQLLKDPTVTKALTSVNQILMQKDLSLASQFEWAVKNYYGTELKMVDFQNQDNNEHVNRSNSNSTVNSNNLQQVINEWVERQTKGKISNFLTSPVASSTMLMALNLVFFKGDWQYKFDPGDTEPEGLFTLPSGKAIKVPMMVNKLPLAHAHDTSMRASLIELPYKAQRLSLFILLPDEHDGILDVMRLLTPNSFASLISQMRKQPASSTSSASAEATGGGINVRIPKFTIESTPRMSQILSQQLGLKTLFSADVADLSGMFSSKRANSSDDQNKSSAHLQVGLDELLHKAVLEVHEQGSVAAAASATIVERVGAFNGQYFEADHTFLFFLMDKQTGLILFSGVFAGPQSGQAENLMLDNQSGLRKAQPVGSSTATNSSNVADAHNNNLLAAARSLKQAGGGNSSSRK